MGPSWLRNPNLFPSLFEGPWETHNRMHYFVRTKTKPCNICLKSLCSICLREENEENGQCYYYFLNVKLTREMCERGDSFCWAAENIDFSFFHSLSPSLPLPLWYSCTLTFFVLFFCLFVIEAFFFCQVNVRTHTVLRNVCANGGLFSSLFSFSLFFYFLYFSEVFCAGFFNHLTIGIYIACFIVSMESKIYLP